MSTKPMKTKTGLVMATGKRATKVLRAAEAAHTRAHIERLKAEMEEVGGPLAWVDFGGGGRVAHSALGAAADPVHLAGEPIVNMADANLELLHRRAVAMGETGVPASPWEAAARYLPLPSAGMREWDVRKGDARKHLADVAGLAELVVLPGTSLRTPSLRFTDRGIGQHPLDFRTTILSLQRGNKADIPYLAGQHGHGAGMTLPFSLGGQVLVSRRAPDTLDGRDDLVGLVVIERFMPSVTGKTSPSYRVLVNAETGMPVCFHHSALEDPQWHGLRRICVDYELGRPAERVGDAASGGLYYHLEHNLPRLPLPYTYRDERGANTQSRRMRGASARIYARRMGWAPKTGATPIEVPYMRTTTVDLGAHLGDGKDYGTVEVTRYVISQGGKGAADTFGPANEAQVWTLNGQVHHGKSRAHFAKAPMRLDSLRDHLRVEVACDGLSPDAKADIFTTDRQGAAERRVTRALQSAVGDTLATDDRLRELDKQAKEAAVNRAANAADLELEKALQDFQVFVKRSETVTVTVPGGPRTRRGDDDDQRPRRPAPNIEPLKPLAPLQKHPTFLRFRTKFRSTIRVEPGRSASILLEADAVDAYFPDHDLRVQISPDAGTTVRVYGADKLEGGRMRIHLKAHPKAKPRSAKLIASYLPPNAAAPLLAEVPLEVVVPTGGERTETRMEEVDAPPPHRVLYKDGDGDGNNSWDAEGMTDWTVDTVAEYRNGVSYINGDFAPLRKAMKANATQRTALLSLYIPGVVMTLVGFQAMVERPPTDDDDNPLELADVFKESTLRNIAMSSLFIARRALKFEECDEEE